MPTKKDRHVLTHIVRPYIHRPIRMKLGRHIVHDPLSWNFPAKKAAKIVSVMHAGSKLLPLDQGELGSCTANAATAAICCAPYLGNVTLPKPIADSTQLEGLAVEFYHDETELHPHDGVYPPEDPGGCGLWIAKVLKNRGLIKSYRHAFGLDHALKALVKVPCIFGIDWYNSFDEPDPSGLVEITPHARVDGGHEVCAFGIDAEKELVWFWQSWGKWGFEGTGKFCMGWATLDRLLKNQGDCTQFVA